MVAGEQWPLSELSNSLTDYLQTPDTFREHLCQNYVGKKDMSKASASTRSNCRRNFARIAAFHWAVAGWSAAFMPLQPATAGNAEENLTFSCVEHRCGLKPALRPRRSSAVHGKADARMHGWGCDVVSLSPQRGEGRGEGWEQLKAQPRSGAPGGTTPHPQSLSPLRGEGSVPLGDLGRRRYFTTRGIELENNLHIPLHGDAPGLNKRRY